jgi:hypothetical protein
MDASRLDRIARRLGYLNTATARRPLVQGAAALGAALAGASIWSEEAAAKKTLCRKNGSKCKKKSKKCKAKHCLTAPFTIEASWTNVNSDHDTYLFVPNEAGATLPSPLIVYTCNPAMSDCEDDVYPFTCVSQDAAGPGDEVTTVRKLIAGTYEYWIELQNPSPAGDLTVTLRKATGKVVRSWSSPENGDDLERGWHVFSINGSKRSITSVNLLIDAELPGGAHDPNTNVCP